MSETWTNPPAAPVPAPSTDTPTPAQPDVSAPPAAVAAASSDPSPAAAPTPAPAASAPAAGSFVHIKHDNGRGTVTESTAQVVRHFEVPEYEDPTDRSKQTGSHVEYDVVPVTTMRVRADQLVDDVED